MSNKIYKYQYPKAFPSDDDSFVPQIIWECDNDPFVPKIIWELLFCFKLLYDVCNDSCDENPYIYFFHEEFAGKGHQVFGRAKVCLTNLHLQVSQFTDWRPRVFPHLQIFQDYNRIDPNWYRNFASLTEKEIFKPFINRITIPADGWTTIIPVPSGSQTLQCNALGWQEFPCCFVPQWAYRYFHPLFYRQKIVSELTNIFLLHKLFPKFFTEVIGVACDYYIVPIGPSYGQNIIALDKAIKENPIILTRLLFDCLLLLCILHSQGLVLNSVNNADLIFVSHHNQPKVQIRNPEIIQKTDNSENLQQGIIQNIQSLRDLVQRLFTGFNHNRPQYLIQNQLINQFLDVWDVHHQCFDLILNYFSLLNHHNPCPLPTLNAFDRFGEKSKRYLVILNALTRLNQFSQPRLYFQNAIEFRVEDSNLLVNFAEQHTFVTNDFAAVREFNTHERIVAYFQDFLRALHLLHNNHIYYMMDFQLYQTIGIRGGVAEFHLRNFDNALMTTGFHEMNTRDDLKSLSKLVGSFLVLKPIQSLFPELYASLITMRDLLKSEVNLPADYMNFFPL